MTHNLFPSLHEPIRDIGAHSTLHLSQLFSLYYYYIAYHYKMEGLMSNSIVKLSFDGILGNVNVQCISEKKQEP